MPGWGDSDLVVLVECGRTPGDLALYVAHGATHVLCCVGEDAPWPVGQAHQWSAELAALPLSVRDAVVLCALDEAALPVVHRLVAQGVRAWGCDAGLVGAFDPQLAPPIALVVGERWDLDGPSPIWTLSRLEAAGEPVRGAPVLVEVAGGQSEGWFRLRRQGALWDPIEACLVARTASLICVVGALDDATSDFLLQCPAVTGVALRSQTLDGGVVRPVLSPDRLQSALVRLRDRFRMRLAIAGADGIVGAATRPYTAEIIQSILQRLTRA